MSHYILDRAFDRNTKSSLINTRNVYIAKCVNLTATLPYKPEQSVGTKVGTILSRTLPVLAIVVFKFGSKIITLHFRVSYFFHVSVCASLTSLVSLGDGCHFLSA